MSTTGHYPTDVSDAQWEVLQLVLPTPKWHPGGPGRKPMDLRCVINSIFYVNKTGCQWRMIPTNIGNAHTIYGYFRRWRRAGSPRGFLALHTSLNKRPDTVGEPPSAEIGTSRMPSLKAKTRGKFAQERYF